MRAKAILAIAICAAVVVLAIAIRPARNPRAPAGPEPAETDPSPSTAESVSPPSVREVPRPPRDAEPLASQPAIVSPIANEPAPPTTTPPTNKLERLTRLREAFRALAAGDPTTALRAAKQLPDETEREAALSTLLEQWTSGEPGSPRARASLIAAYDLEAGLGLQLTKDPQLALLWANELTTGTGRLAIFQQSAITMLSSDPAAAFALSNQLPEADRRQFTDAVFAGWGAHDTAAALQWVQQLADPAERDAALQAIRTTAPVGIGTAIAVKDGYPVIANVIPGTPAELSGQIQAGDRIVGLAQGNNAFIDARNLPLADLVQMIRGAPGTVLQLQLLPADAPPGSQPRTISVTRDQLKFKR